MYSYLYFFGLVSDNQFGFGKRCPMMHFIHHLLDNLKDKFERKLIPLTVFTDLQQNFNTVDFRIFMKR